jgi:hypothetical protein
LSAANPGLTAVVGRPVRAPAIAQRLLNLILFVTVLTSSIAFIEPSPHDALMLVLAAACVTARVPFDRKLIPLLLILGLWLIGVLLALPQVSDDPKAIQYVAISLYLDVAAIMFACLLSTGDAQRLSIIRRAYILSALIATAAGYAGYFHLIPGAQVFLDITADGPSYSARLSATFKDPNVYGPFLIFPLLMLMIGFLTKRITLVGLAATVLLLGGLFLSFSRGAWIHFVVSATICILLLMAVTNDPRKRARIITLTVVAAIGVTLLVVALISVGPIHEMFIERAKAIQPYDAGPGGRFTLQRLALDVILANPNGLGPFGFFHTFGTQQHNVYLQSFIVYGWLGGTAYLTLIWVTLTVGLRGALIPASSQPYLAAAYGVFVGELVEGAIVDTDHWRHFYLMLGMIWGLTIAAINQRQRAAWAGRSVVKPA